MNKHHDGKSEPRWLHFVPIKYKTQYLLRIQCEWPTEKIRFERDRFILKHKHIHTPKLYITENSIFLRMWDWTHSSFTDLDQYDKCDKINYIHGSILFMSFIYFCVCRIPGDETSWQVAWLHQTHSKWKWVRRRRKKKRRAHQIGVYRTYFGVIIKVICEVEAAWNRNIAIGVWNFC